MRRLAALLAPLLAAACATLETAPSAHLDSAVPELRACAAWFRDLDARVDIAGVRDAQEMRLPGFPYLRVDRLLASFRGEAASDEAVLRALVERMRALDLAARRYEVANLPPGSPEAPPTLERARECGARLRDADVADPRLRTELLARAMVPDDYSSASRALGLYALSKIPFSWGVRRYQEEVRIAHRRELAPPPGGTVLRYAPPAAPQRTRAALAAALDPASDNPLRVAELRGDELEALFSAYAPVLEIEVAGEHDRFGALRWENGAEVPVVDAAVPVVYRQAAWTRYRGRVLLQLVYTLWFSERPPAFAGDILAGKLDGVTWRVTLAPDGEPLVYDTMHPCGCFHLFYPTPRAVPLEAPEGELEWMFSPQSLPRITAGERPVVRVAMRTHYVERVSVARAGGDAARYAFRDYDDLRALPRPGGGSASVFGADGLVAGSERPERFFFWPMGIPSAGAMRQWGRHATAFVGRRHFDDADLLEKRFELQLRQP
jgi:hypothetical protein